MPKFSNLRDGFRYKILKSKKFNFLKVKILITFQNNQEFGIILNFVQQYYSIFVLNLAIINTKFKFMK
jgi:hypothetical protein